MSEEISDSGKIPKKFISSIFEAKSKTTFGYFSPEIDRKRAEDISDYISAGEYVRLHVSLSICRQDQQVSM